MTMGKTWKSKLTKKERKHLNEMGIRTIQSMKIQVAHIKGELAKGTNGIVCWDCIAIAKKLGMWE